MSEPAVPSKRIVICCDGTWQSSVSGEANIPSNITRLCRQIARTGTDKDGRVWQQLVYYDSGVGTGSLGFFEKKRQGAIGDGLAVNVIEAYNFIVLNYAPGDEIFCFGFSRGAYTARAVAGLVADLGVMEPRYMQIFPDIYDIYKKNVPTRASGYVQTRFRDSQGWQDFVNGKRAATPDAVKLQAELDQLPYPRRRTDEELRILWEIQPHGEVAINEESRNVKVVGVFDTVGALGVPDSRFFDNSAHRVEYGFHNVKLNKNIENAFQALALDERRKAFAPTLWYIPKDRPESERTSNLLQVWFPGVHINIGGGSSDTAKGKGDAEQMANITFAWMVERVRPYLAFNATTIAQNAKEYTALLETIHCRNNHRHDPSKTPSLLSRVWAAIWAALPTVWGIPPQAPLAVGWGTAPYIDSYRGLMAWAGEKRRCPGECETEVVVANEAIPGRWFHREVLAPRALAELGETNEMVHPVARFRSVMSGNGDKGVGALKGWRVRQDKAGTGFEWVKEVGGKEGLVLEEYVIQGNSSDEAIGNVERLAAAEVLEAVEFLKKTDLVNGIAVDEW